MNQEFEYEILDMLKTIQEAAYYLQECRDNGNVEEFEAIKKDLYAGLITVKQICEQCVLQGSPIRLGDACACAVESLKNIDYLLMQNNKKADQKISFELVPIIETMLLQFYYWGIVFTNPEKEAEFKDYLNQVGINRRIEQAEKSGEYKYDLSILVTAYNKLDYTKKCVQSVLKEMPKNVRCELILFNHGSSDGTKEFFDSIPEAKTIDVAVNFAVPGVVYKAVEGKYLLSVSNDIVIGNGAIVNLYRCIAEHEDYGWVVPTTPNVSNLQTISLEYNYSNEEEFASLMKKNNVYNERRHEERVRLCNPVDIMKTVDFVKLIKDMYIEIFGCKDTLSFPDDKMSLWTRRNGLKLILAKDAYCHHFGSITIGKSEAGDKERAKFYLEGRLAFFRSFGVDPWGPGFCYDIKLMNGLDYTVAGQINILGINCGLGSNPLKIKEIYREIGRRREDIYICNLIQEERFLQDISAVSDDVFLFQGMNDISKVVGDKHYDYVVIEDQMKGYEYKEAFVAESLEILNCTTLCYKSPEKEPVPIVMDDAFEVHTAGNWVIIRKK